jgi:peptide/nickel transport system permease protein
MFIDAARLRSGAAHVRPSADRPPVAGEPVEVAKPWSGIAPVLVTGLTLLVLALVAPALARYDPRLSVASPLQAPDLAHWLGTNDIGQDVLSQWLYAVRATLANALTVVALATALAWSAGILAGLHARADAPIVATIDLLLALPALPLYMLVLTLIGPTQSTVALVLGLLAWPAFARVVRAQVIATREAPYVEAARGLGASPIRIAVTHVLPATLAIFPAHLVLTLRFAVFAEATLAFLGLGDPSAASWGGMLGWAFANPLLFTTVAWIWLVLPPAFGIALLLLLAGGVSEWTEARPGTLTAAPARSGRAVRTCNDRQCNDRQHLEYPCACFSKASPWPTVVAGSEESRWPGGGDGAVARAGRDSSADGRRNWHPDRADNSRS